METHWFVYLLTDAGGGSLYVGVTRNLVRRLNEHRRALGFRPAYEILEEGDGDAWSHAEKKWIAFYGGPSALLNRSHGGVGPQMHSQSTKERLSRLFTGRSLTREWKQKIGAAHRGLKKNYSKEGLEIQRKNLEGGRAKGLKKKLSSAQRKCQLEILSLGRIKRQQLPPERRAEIGKNISKAHRSKPTHIRSESARAGGVAMQAKHPNLCSQTIRKWWTDLRANPEAYSNFIERRAAAKRASK